MAAASHVGDAKRPSARRLLEIPGLTCRSPTNDYAAALGELLYLGLFHLRE
jgi:hypothetical protein